MGQITATRNLVAIKVVRHAGQQLCTWPRTIMTMWQQSWCNMSKVRPEYMYIIIIKIRAKSVFTKFGFWAQNFLLIYPLAYPVQVQLIVTFQKLFAARNIVFPSFGREKLGKTGLSQFIPFWTAKTGFGLEKTQPCPNLNGFCLNLCRPPGAYSIRPIQKLLNCQQRDDVR